MGNGSASLKWPFCELHVLALPEKAISLKDLGKLSNQGQFIFICFFQNL